MVSDSVIPYILSRYPRATGIDSCFVGDVPMARVKMNAKHEYEFIANFKVLQNVFRAKKVDKARLCPL